MQMLIDNLESIDIKVPNGVKLIFIEKEKQQIINAWIAIESPLQRIAAEKYYNETFKK